MACGFSRKQCCHFLKRIFTKQPTFTGRAQYLASSTELWELYNARKTTVAEAKPVANLNPKDIYANYELSLSDIKVVGFDYDYTLASYTPDLHRLIFHLSKTALVNNLKYPPEILDLEFDPSFAARGVHFDIQKGVFMKVDSFHYIQLGTVYRGLRKVPDAEVKEMYDGIHLSVDYLSSSDGTMIQMIDLFAIPEICLIALIIEYFDQNNIEYDPEYVFYDIQNTVQSLHKSGILHQNIMGNLDLYLEKTEETKVLLERLRTEGKKLFLITNSGFPFVKAGMHHMVGADWLDLFNIVIVKSRKPKFFHKGSRPFRLYDPLKETYSWGRVTSLEKGKVYQEGNLFQLQDMTGWFGPQVLYFGDHVYSDLADPSLRFGWRTGAIVPELEYEIQQYNKPEFKAAIRWMVVLEHMIDDQQHQGSTESREVIAKWLEERERLRVVAKSCYNLHFGSLFRTPNNPTYFFQRLARFSDIYMSSLTNLLHYPPHYTFYPHRMVLPHEPSPFYHMLID